MRKIILVLIALAVIMASGVACAILVNVVDEDAASSSSNDSDWDDDSGWDDDTSEDTVSDDTSVVDLSDVESDVVYSPSLDNQ